MELISALVQNESTRATVGARPTTLAHGVDLTAARQGAFSFSSMLVHIVAGPGAGVFTDADTTIAGPGGASGGLGVEVWMLKRSNSGPLGTSTKYIWELTGYLNGGAAVPVLSGYGTSYVITAGTIGERIAIAGLPGAGTPQYYVEPIERSVSELR